MSTVDVVLKQADIDAFDGAQRRAMTFLFSGYEHPQPSPSTFARIRKGVQDRGVPPDELSYMATSRHRRFAGDESLPRRKYYAIANDPSGNDRGTLLAELHAYANVAASGVCLLYDNTLPEHRQSLHDLRVTKPTLVVDLRRTRRRPSPALEQLADAAVDGRWMRLPLKVERRRIKWVLDLRNPRTADALAAAIHLLSPDTALGLQLFQGLPPISSFAGLIPSLLEQNLGGTVFQNTLAHWLRVNGAQGVIYPSARADPDVTVRRGRVAAWSSFNFVSYENVRRPEAYAMLTFLGALPERVMMRGDGSAGSQNIAVPGVRVSYREDGLSAGSWCTEGLRHFNQTDWYAKNIKYMMEELVGPRATDLVRRLSPWVLTRLRRETGGQVARTVFEALLEEGGGASRLADLVVKFGQVPDTGELAGLLAEFAAAVE